MEERYQKGELILLRGLPGSGKSTLAKSIAGGNEVLSADDYFTDENGNYNFDPSKLTFAHQDCIRRCENQMIKKHGIVVVANTFTQKWEMEPYYELAKRYGYIVHSIIIENRHGGRNVHGVPDDKIEIMRKRFDINL